MAKTIENSKDKQSVLSQIQNFFTLGHGKKEDLRELDKKLRSLYYADLMDLRHVWEDVHLGLSSFFRGNYASSDDLKKVLQNLDVVIEKVNRADYGYAGLMVGKRHMREEELARAFNCDRTLGDYIGRLKETINKTQADFNSENWKDVPTDVTEVKGLLLKFEEKWRGREKEFRLLEL